MSEKKKVKYISILLTAGFVVMASGCVAAKKPVSEEPPVNVVQRVLTENAKNISEEMGRLMISQGKDPSTMGTAPSPSPRYPELSQPIKVLWNGPLTEGIRAVASAIGWKAEAYGREPDQTVVVDTYDRANAQDILQSFGVQAGKRATIIADIPTRTLRVVYSSYAGKDAHKFTETKPSAPKATRSSSKRNSGKKSGASTKASPKATKSKTPAVTPITTPPVFESQKTPATSPAASSTSPATSKPSGVGVPSAPAVPSQNTNSSQPSRSLMPVNPDVVPSVEKNNTGGGSSAPVPPRPAQERTSLENSADMLEIPQWGMEEAGATSKASSEKAGLEPAAEVETVKRGSRRPSSVSGKEAAGGKTEFSEAEKKELESLLN